MLVASNGGSFRLTVPPEAEEEDEGRAGMVSFGMPGLRGFLGGMSEAMFAVDQRPGNASIWRVGLLASR